jgi:hypothetical protein|tara:strand:- start:325 stop:435 length:111 start_codon:yes stop_codon:yes gene_type:complete
MHKWIKRHISVIELICDAEAILPPFCCHFAAILPPF